MTARIERPVPHPPHEDLVRYLEGALDTEAFKLLRRHLYWCPQCAGTVDLLAGVARLRRERRARRKGRGKGVLVLLGVAALAVLLWSLWSTTGARTERAKAHYLDGEWDEAARILSSLVEDAVDGPEPGAHANAARLITIRFKQRDAKGALAAAETGESILKGMSAAGVAPPDPTSWRVAMRLRQARAHRILRQVDEARRIEREVESTLASLEAHKDRTRGEMHLYRHLLWSAFRESTPAKVVLQRAQALVEASEHYASTWAQGDLVSIRLHARTLAARALVTVYLARGEEDALGQAREILAPVRTLAGPKKDLRLEARRLELEAVMRLGADPTASPETAKQVVPLLRAALHLYEQDGSLETASPTRNLGAALALAGDHAAARSVLRGILARADVEEAGGDDVALSHAAVEPYVDATRTGRGPRLPVGPPPDPAQLSWITTRLLANWRSEANALQHVEGLALADFLTWQGAPFRGE